MICGWRVMGLDDGWGHWDNAPVIEYRWSGGGAGVWEVLKKWRRAPGIGCPQYWTWVRWERGGRLWGQLHENVCPWCGGEGVQKVQGGGFCGIHQWIYCHLLVLDDVLPWNMANNRSHKLMLAFGSDTSPPVTCPASSLPTTNLSHMFACLLTLYKDTCVGDLFFGHMLE